MKLKVCGMRESENIQEVSRLKPDFMGFIFYRPSPRFVGDQFNPPATPGVDRVGVFVNETTDEILAKVSLHNLRYVQLHGSETVEQCAELKHHNVLIIKVFSVAHEIDFSLLKSYQAAVDFFLFDTKGKYFGGNASKFNWKLLEGYDVDTPFFLSGGIGPDDMEAIASITHPKLYGIDVNSGVEVSPGLKDVSKVKTIKSKLLKI
jgi:phosphoribosylanthranilate isomerase